MIWISVEDRLPEQYRVVKVLTICGEEYTACLDIDDTEEEEKYFFALVEDDIMVDEIEDEVTHWMPE